MVFRPFRFALLSLVSASFISQQVFIQAALVQAQNVQLPASVYEAGEFFTGTWESDDYVCKQGQTKCVEVVKITVVNGFLNAVKTVGNDYVLKGSQTFAAQVPATVSAGTSFRVKEITGKPGNPSSLSEDGTLTVVNANEFTIDNFKFVRSG